MRAGGMGRKKAARGEPNVAEASKGMSLGSKNRENKKMKPSNMSQSAIDEASWIEAVSSLKDWIDQVRSSLPKSATEIQVMAVTACVIDRVDLVELLTGKGASLNERDLLGQNMLHWAAASASPKVVEALLRMGSDPNEVDLKGCSPISKTQWLSMDGHRIARSLLRAGAKADSRDESGRTMLMRLRFKSERNEADVAFNASVEALAESMLALGCPIEARDPQGRQAAHLAAGTGDLRMIEWLRRHGADLFKPDAEGRSPRDHARSVGQIETVDHLDRLALAIQERAELDQQSKKPPQEPRQRSGRSRSL